MTRLIKRSARFNLLVAVIAIIVIAVIATVFLLPSKPLLEPSMVKEVIVKYDNKIYTFSPDSREGKIIIEKVDEVLSGKVSRLRCAYYGEEVREIMNKSHYVMLILNNKYEVIPGNDYKTDKFIVFLSGEKEGMVVAFGGMHLGREIWGCWGVRDRGKLDQLKTRIEELLS